MKDGETIQPTAKTDYQRLVTATARLAAMGWSVAAESCCHNCNWEFLERDDPDFSAITFTSEHLDDAFGQRTFDALSPDEKNAYET